jgi:GDP-4-dehydro-6-deoxy-D-mannose reductase
LDVNLTGAHNLLKAVRNTGCRARVLLAGTSEEYGYANQPGPTVHELSPTLPTTPYGVSKLAATTLGQVYAQQHGMDVICTRAFNHTGPGQPSVYAVPAFARRVAEAELTGRPVEHGNLDAVRNYTDVRDVVRAYIDLLRLNAPAGIYNVASPYTVSMKEILDMLVGLAKTPVTLVQSDTLWRPSGSDVFYPPDTTKIQDAIGWETHHNLCGGTLRDLLNYWRGRA